MDEILVSVLCMTYNHERYIGEALESFLAQEVDFKYEIIVHDDASTDSTADIIRSYESKYPEIIHGIYEKENQYSRHVQLFFSIMQDVCQGKYMAICEGDDYWIDNHKLQMQVDYLEKHSTCVLTVHDAMVINLNNSEIKPMCPYKDDGDILPEELIIQKYGILPTASMVFKRQSARINMDDIWVKAGCVGDYPLQLLLLTRGKIHYFSQVMSAYRFMHEESWSKKIGNDLNGFIIHTVQMIHFLEEYNNYTKEVYTESIRKRINRFEKGIFFIYQQHLPLERFKTDLNQYDEETGFLYHNEFLKIKEDFLQIFGRKDLSQSMIDFCSGHQYIYIMGAGRFASVIMRQLNCFNIEIDGFVVSPGEKNEKMYMNKPVLELDELNFNLKDIGIVLGLNVNKWDGIYEILEKAGVKDYLLSSILRGLIKLEEVWE